MLEEFIISSVKRNLTGKTAFHWHVNSARNVRSPSVTQFDRLAFYLHRKIVICQNGRYNLSQYRTAAQTGKHQNKTKICRSLFFHVNRHFLNLNYASHRCGKPRVMEAVFLVSANNNRAQTVRFFYGETETHFLSIHIFWCCITGHFILRAASGIIS